MKMCAPFRRWGLHVRCQGAGGAGLGPAWQMQGLWEQNRPRAAGPSLQALAVPVPRAASPLLRALCLPASLGSPAPSRFLGKEPHESGGGCVSPSLSVHCPTFPPPGRDFLLAVGLQGLPAVNQLQEETLRAEPRLPPERPGRSPSRDRSSPSDRCTGVCSAPSLHCVQRSEEKSPLVSLVILSILESLQAFERNCAWVSVTLDFTPGLIFKSLEVPREEEFWELICFWRWTAS